MKTELKSKLEKRNPIGNTLLSNGAYEESYGNVAQKDTGGFETSSKTTKIVFGHCFHALTNDRKSGAKKTASYGNRTGHVTYANIHGVSVGHGYLQAGTSTDSKEQDKLD